MGRWPPVVAGTVTVGVMVLGATVFAMENSDPTGLTQMLRVLGAGLAVLTPAVVGWWRRPDDPDPRIAVAASAVVCVAYFRLLANDMLSTAGATAWLLGASGVLVALARGVGAPRARRVRVGHVAVAIGGAVQVFAASRDGRSGIRALTWLWVDPARDIGVRQRNLLHAVDSSAAVWVGWGLWAVGLSVVSIGVARSLTGRWAAPILASAVVATMLGAIPVSGDPTQHWYFDVLWIVPVVAVYAVAARMVLVELVMPRLASTAARRYRLSADTAPDAMDAALADNLDDPTARLIFRRQDGWIDGRGRRAILDAPGRAAVALSVDGEVVAALDVDLVTAGHVDLLTSAVAGIAYTLAAQHLAVAADADAEAVRNSARRTLEATERARVALERRVLDGPDRRLSDVAAALADEHPQLGWVHDQLRAAVTEVRDIAHGDAPVWVDDGDAVATLRRRSDRLAIVVEVADDVPTDIPPSVQRTVWLLVDAACATGDEVIIAAVSTADGLSLLVTLTGVDHLPADLCDRLDALGAGWTASDSIMRVRVPLVGVGDSAS